MIEIFDPTTMNDLLFLYLKKDDLFLIRLNNNISMIHQERNKKLIEKIHRKKGVKNLQIEPEEDTLSFFMFNRINFNDPEIREDVCNLSSTNIHFYGEYIDHFPKCDPEDALFQGAKKLLFTRYEDDYIWKLPENIGDFQNLEELSAYYAGLTKDLPESISRLSNLKRLDLSSNAFVTFPEVITKLKNLEELDLASNHPENAFNIVDSTFDSIPESIGRMQSLKRLVLKGNRLKKVPKTIGHLENLETLDLSHNELSSLPKSIENLKNLQQLNLYWNNFEFEELDGMKQKLEQLRNISEKIEVMKTTLKHIRPLIQQGTQIKL